MAAKVQEAQEHCRAAEKFLKTSLLRWKPDLNSAADEYSEAAKCYRVAGDRRNCKEYYLKASDLYAKNRSFFYAAKCLENAIIAAKDFTSPEELYSMAMESSNFYQQHSFGDSGASILDKTAKIIEENNPELAYKLFAHAADVSSTESSQHQGSEYISKASRILVKLQRYDEAVDSIRREIGFHQESGNMGAIGRLTVAIVLVQLARGDTVAAEKAYKEWGNNCEAQEMQTIEQLLQAYDEEDRESAKRALASPFIRNMDVEYSRLSTTIELPEAMEPAPKATVRENAAPSYVSPTASYNKGARAADTTSVTVDIEATPSHAYTKKEDEEEDDLC